MIVRLINATICRIKSHDLINAGGCPYNGQTYQYCKRYTSMIPTMKVD